MGYDYDEMTDEELAEIKEKLANASEALRKALKATADVEMRLGHSQAVAIMREVMRKVRGPDDL